MNWTVTRPDVRFDIHAERAEYARLVQHPARVLQDRLVRLGGGDRTREIPVTDWEKEYRRDARARTVLHQARVLAWGKEKSYYYAHKSA